jgi:predicted dehydrogenase
VAPLRTAIVGCGNVAPRYAGAIERSAQLILCGATSRTLPRASELVDRFGGTVYADLDELLADDDLDLVVNLTTQEAHGEITGRCLEAGKHVYSEKPLAVSASEAWALVELANTVNRGLGCAPSTFLGPPQQEAIRRLQGGCVGTLRVIYAETNWGRIELWHPAPEPFYAIGPVYDVGVYPLTFLTAAIGPVARVRAFGRLVLPDRTTMAGRPFEPGAPDFMVALLEFASGPVARLTTNFYVPMESKQRGIEFHGDEASLYLASVFEGDAALEFAELGSAYGVLPTPAGSFPGVDYGLGLVELADAIASGRPQRGSGARAAHVTEVLEAISTAAISGRHVDVPPPLGALAS